MKGGENNGEDKHLELFWLKRSVDRSKTEDWSKTTVPFWNEELSGVETSPDVVEMLTRLHVFGAAC